MCALAPVARAGPGLLVGVDDDGLKWQSSADFLAPVQDLGLSAVRVTFPWRPGRTRPSFSDSGELANVAAASTTTRVVVEVGAGRPSVPPRTRRQRAQYCAYLVQLLRAAPAVKDVVLWTEADEPRVWRQPDEDGYQSSVGDRRSAYHGKENVTDLLDPGFQGWQLQASVRLAYCQPAVGAFFNFQLRDDPDLVGWQSGVLYADGPPKPAYGLLE